MSTSCTRQSRPARAQLSSSAQHLGEEVLALAVHDDEGGEVLDVDLPDGLHAQLGVLQNLDLQIGDEPGEARVIRNT
jgi:hypothetical protein